MDKKNPAPATAVSKPGKAPATMIEKPGAAPATEIKINKTTAESSNSNVLFPKANIFMMIGCLALIIIGFLLMSGGSSSIEGGFNPDIFSTRRIVIGPTIAFLGFLLMAFAIIYTPKKSKK